MRLNHIIVASRHMFTLFGWFLGLMSEEGGYRVVSEHGSPLGLDGRNMVVMHACRLNMHLLCVFVVYVDVCMHCHGYSCCAWGHGMWLVWSCMVTR